jgi:peptidoglycan/LPS O-acetylase OafA/YrhL
LLPIPQILVYYAIFFFFGAIYFDSDDRDATLGSRWYVTLPLALLIIFPLGFEMTTGAWGFSNPWLGSKLYHPFAVFLQVAYVWLISFGLMGAFRRVYSAENRTMRYLSDSSYWLYLAHLPLILLVQAMVRTWELPLLVKFTLVCAVTTAILLASYQLFVRYTPIGTLLNGPRRRPKKESAQSAYAATANVCE